MEHFVIFFVNTKDASAINFCTLLGNNFEIITHRKHRKRVVFTHNQIVTYFRFNVHQCRSQSFLSIPVHLSTVYFTETRVPPPWLGALSKKHIEFRVFRLT